LALSLYFDGKAHPIQAKVCVNHCVYGDGFFKIGLSFIDLNPAELKGITTYIHS